MRIVAYSYRRQTRSAGGGSHSRWRYYHKLYIDTGKEKFDNYLKGYNYNMIFSSYDLRYDNLLTNTSIDFYDVQEYIGGRWPSVTTDLIYALYFKNPKISQESNITYNNMPVKYYDRQDNWGDEGNNNL